MQMTLAQALRGRRYARRDRGARARLEALPAANGQQNPNALIAADRDQAGRQRARDSCSRSGREGRFFRRRGRRAGSLVSIRRSATRHAPPRHMARRRARSVRRAGALGRRSLCVEAEGRPRAARALRCACGRTGGQGDGACRSGGSVSAGRPVRRRQTRRRWPHWKSPRRSSARRTCCSES